MEQLGTSDFYGAVNDTDDKDDQYPFPLVREGGPADGLTRAAHDSQEAAARSRLGPDDAWLYARHQRRPRPRQRRPRAAQERRARVIAGNDVNLGLVQSSPRVVHDPM